MVLVVLAAAIAGGLLFVRPRRYEVDGLSMAPSLLPGDIVSSWWLPQRDRFVVPRRFERWLAAAPDGRPAIKRIAGLPGETLSIVGGDLAIDDAVMLTPPDVLAEVALPVAVPTSGEGAWQRTVAAAIVYDDAPFAPNESRRLLPVHDVGLAAVVDATQAAPLEAVIRVGSKAVRWRLARPARHALVAGRLDGRLVAAAWALPPGSPVASDRSPLPPSPPSAWPIAEPWTEADGDNAPALGLRLARDGMPLPADESDAMILACTAWRDILHRPPANGMAAWRIGSGEIFLLGDFPSGSRDSRHWGPLPRTALHHRAHHLGEPSPDR